MIKYGLTQADIRHYRWLLSLGRPHDYLMMHLAQTYRTRKVMYDSPVRNWCVRPDCPVLCTGLSQGS